MLKLICVCNYYCAVDKLGTGEYLHKFADFNIVVHEISSNPKTDETALEGVDQSGMQVKVHLQQSWTPHLPFKIGDVLAIKHAKIITDEAGNVVISLQQQSMIRINLPNPETVKLQVWYKTLVEDAAASH